MTTDNTDFATLSPPEEAGMGSVLSVHISEISDSNRQGVKIMDWYNQIGLVIVLVVFALLGAVKYSEHKSRKVHQPN